MPVVSPECDLRTAFEAAYSALYGQVIPGQPVEVLSWTLTLATEANRLIDGDTCEAEEPVAGQTLMYDGENAVDTAVYQRYALAHGDRIAGPALVVEDQTTTVVPEDFEFYADAHGQLVLESRR